MNVTPIAYTLLPQFSKHAKRQNAPYIQPPDQKEPSVHIASTESVYRQFSIVV